MLWCIYCKVSRRNNYERLSIYKLITVKYSHEFRSDIILSTFIKMQYIQNIFSRWNSFMRSSWFLKNHWTTTNIRSKFFKLVEAMQKVAQVDRSPFFFLGKCVVQMPKNSDNCHQLDMSNCNISLTKNSTKIDNTTKTYAKLMPGNSLMKMFSSMILFSETSQNFFANN